MDSNQHLHVIFGAGPVGRALMNELNAEGKPVRIVNRRGMLDAPASVEVRAGDASDPDTARRLCQSASVVYQCANAPYTAWPEKFPPLQDSILAGAAAAGARLVVMENVYMYGPNQGRPLTENLPYAAKTRKGRTRARMAEELLAAHAAGRVQVAIGRASDFFGPGVIDSAAGERMFVPALTGKTVQVLGNPDLPHTYTYVPDIANGLVILGERPEAVGRAWHLPSPETVSTRRFIELICQETGQKARLQAASHWLIGALGLFNPLMREVAEMQYEYEEPFIVDASDFEKTFHLPATPLEQAVHATAGWFTDRLNRHPA